MAELDYEKDLIVLLPGKDEKAALQALLGREAALGIRPVSADFETHPERDPGCRLRSNQYLQRYIRRYRHALVVFDHEGCGKETRSRVDLEAEVETALASSGWGDRAAAIVIDPELEVWVWSPSPHVPMALGWTGSMDDLKVWLSEKRLWRPGEPKPHCPKEAVEAALQRAKRPRSSMIYGELARIVGLTSCADPAFQKLRKVLREWFPGPDISPS